MAARNQVSWNALVAAHAKHGRLEDARAAFDTMPLRDVVSWNGIISAYARCGRMEEARALFDRMPLRNASSWNCLVSGYSREGSPLAFRLLRQMDLEGVEPNRITFLVSLDACAREARLDEGRLAHGRIVEKGLNSDAVLCNGLMNMYGKCKRLRDARDLFERMVSPDVVSWTTMISNYAQNGFGALAIQFADRMMRGGIKPNRVTLISLFDASVGLGELGHGKAMHASVLDSGLESDPDLTKAALNMYGKCGSLMDAERVFRGLVDPDVSSWTCLITASARNSDCKTAADRFQAMLTDGVVPDAIAFVSILDACADAASLELGKTTHARVAQFGIELHVDLVNALINMYSKCGFLHDAKRMFAQVCCRNVVTWTSMMTAYAQNGQGKQVLELFQEMIQADGGAVKPDEITFLCVLSACSFVGLVDDGLHFFVSMYRDYGIVPTVGHYVCTVDLLGRAGRLDEAEGLINSMPCNFHAVAWICLLNACRIRGDVEREAHAKKHLSGSDTANAAQKYYRTSSLLRLYPHGIA